MRHFEVTLEIDGRLLHGAQSKQVGVARVDAPLVSQEAIGVDESLDGDVSLDGADTGDVEAEHAIVGSEDDIEQVGAETAVLLTLGERLREQFALG